MVKKVSKKLKRVSHYKDCDCNKDFCSGLVILRGHLSDETIPQVLDSTISIESCDNKKLLALKKEHTSYKLQATIYKK